MTRPPAQRRRASRASDGPARDAAPHDGSAASEERPRPSARIGATQPDPTTQSLQAVEPQVSPAAREEAGSTQSMQSVAQFQDRQVLRTRWLVVVATGIVVTVLAGALAGGDPTARWMLLAAIAVAGAGVFWLSRVTLRPQLIAEGKELPAWLTLTGGIALGLPFFGTYSPGPALFVLCIFFCGWGCIPRVAISVWAWCGFHLALQCTLLVTGVVRDPGMVSSASMTTVQQVSLAVIMQLILLATLIIGVFVRRATTRAAAELDEATRQATRTETLLVEAREQLERTRLLDSGAWSGQVLGGYRLGAVIGRGGMGEVYEATHVGSTAPAAVKVLRAESLDKKSMLRRFAREARAGCALDVPNVVRVLDVSDEEAVVPFIAMERLRGEDLGAHLRARLRLDPDEVVEMLRQVAVGVDAAHRAGIVHRDLKPSNLFLHRPESGSPVWKVLDFGIAKSADESQTLTEGALVGTPAYMAPEQAEGGEVGPRTDLHALGAITFRALTGRLPFVARSTPELLYQIVHAPVPRATQLVPELPVALDLVLAVALAKAPRERFSCAQELADAVAQAAAGHTPKGLVPRARTVVR